MAFGGLHPVVAIYATFLNRAFDQVLMDVALHKAGVTFVLDRAGVTGPDGASHHGMWDMAMLQIVPGLHLAAPRGRRPGCGRSCARRSPSRTRRRGAVPKGTVGAEVEADRAARRRRRRAGTPPGRPTENDVLIVSVGAMSELALDVAEPARRPGHQLHRGGPALGGARAALHHRAGRRSTASWS